MAFAASISTSSSYSTYPKLWLKWLFSISFTEALAIEAADGTAAEAYANILAVKEGNENNEAIQALLRALQSEEVREYINKTYGGAVVPVF